VLICMQLFDNYTNPKPLSLSYTHFPSPMIKWPSTSTSSNLPASTMARVTATSSGLGITEWVDIVNIPVSKTTSKRKSLESENRPRDFFHFSLDIVVYRWEKLVSVNLTATSFLDKNDARCDQGTFKFRLSFWFIRPFSFCDILRSLFIYQLLDETYHTITMGSHRDF